MLRKLSRALGVSRLGQNWLSRDGESQAAPARPRLKLPDEPSAIYAIGDIHGCLDKLLRLEALIIEDARQIAGQKLIIALGDYVDRGPDSASVLDHLLSEPPDGFRRLCIAGNHEQMMLDLLSGRLDIQTWLDFGGGLTMLSYGVDFDYLTRDVALSAAQAIAEFRDAVPEAHSEFLARLPAAVETQRYYFVHAGVRPAIPLDRQHDDDLLFIRDDFLSADLSGLAKTVVHGHTPGAAIVTEKRIGLDTGAYLGGPLTAARITAESIALLSVS